MATTPTTTDDKPAATPKSLKVGQVVGYVYFDHYSGAGGQDANRVGIVTSVGEIDVTDESGTVSKAPAAQVAWLESTDPIPADALTAL